MKHIIIALFLALGVSATAQIKLYGHVMTEESYDLTIHECDNSWNILNTIEVPYQSGIFGKKNDYALYNMESKLYIVVFKGDTFEKTIYFDFTRFKGKSKQEIDIIPDNREYDCWYDPIIKSLKFRVRL